MKFMLWVFLLGLVAGQFSGANAAAKEQPQAYRHPLTNLPPSSEDIGAVYFFPNNPAKQFFAGEQVKVAVGIHNHGSEPYNISGIMGSLNAPDAFAVYVQNFTQQLYFDVLPPGDELSVEYTFRPDAYLPAPREWTVALTLFYESLGSDSGFYSTTFFNQTVDVVEAKRLVDTDLLFMWLTLAALAAGAGYLAYRKLTDTGVLKKGPKRAKSTAATSATRPDTEDDWLKGTTYDLHKRKKSASQLKLKEDKEKTPVKATPQ